MRNKKACIRISLINSRPYIVKAALGVYFHNSGHSEFIYHVFLRCRIFDEPVGKVVI